MSTVAQIDRQYRNESMRKLNPLSRRIDRNLYRRVELEERSAIDPEEVVQMEYLLDISRNRQRR